MCWCWIHEQRKLYDKTIETKKVTFWSRSRKCLWTKGETSGNFLNLVSIQNDCDNDTLLVKGIPLVLLATRAPILAGAENDINPYCSWHIFRISSKSVMKKCQLVVIPRVCSMTDWTIWLKRLWKEALEAVIEATNGTNERLIYEASDMFYHLIVLLTRQRVTHRRYCQELQTRHDPNWHKHD